MNHRPSLLFFTALLTAYGSICTAEVPHIGFAYPAGARQDTVIDVLVGGQFLEGTTNVLISGEGVDAEILGYSVKYSQKELRKIFRKKKKALEVMEERNKDGASIKKEQKQLETIERQLALADLPDGVNRSNQRSVLKSAGSNSKDQFNPQIAERLRLRLTIDRQAEPGVRELRVYTPEGLSNPLFFEVGSFKEFIENEPNDDHMSPDLATLTLPSIINGQVGPGDIDHFRFRAVKGDSIVVHVSARRIIPYLADAVPGWFQAVVALYDENGQEIAYQDDYKFNPDPVLFFDVPESGLYTLSIRDSIYRGREDFIYRIAIGELPFITGIYPLGGQAGQTVNIALSGRNLPKTQITGTLPGNSGTIQQLSVKKNGYRSNLMPFVIDSLPEQFESEPNDTREQAPTNNIPFIVNGRIDRPGDRDLFCFQGKKGEVISIGIAARQLNSPLDSALTLTGPGLETPIRNDDYSAMGANFLHLGSGLVTHQADSYILQELPATGTYQVEVIDTQHKGGSDYAYRLRMARAQPDFEMRMEPSGVQIAPGGTAVFTVRAIRREGFDAAVSITADHLPSGFSISDTVIPKGSESTLITITAPKDISSLTVSPVIIGTAELDGTAVVRRAVPVDDQMQAFLYRHLVPAHELVLAPVSEPTKLSFQAIVPASGIVELPLGREVRIRVKGVMETKNKGAKLDLNHAPPGLSVVKGWISRKKNNAGDEGNAAVGNIVLKAEDPLKPGDRMNLVVVAKSKMGKQETLYPSPAIQAVVVSPAE